RQGLVVEMVGRRDLSNAVALNTATVAFGRVAGPVMAALLVATIGEGWCFVANGATYGVALGTLLGMGLGPTRPARPRASALGDAVDLLRGAKGPVLALPPLSVPATLAATSWTLLAPFL